MKKQRINRITSRPNFGDTTSHVCFEQCSQSRCELNPDCIQRVKSINEVTPSFADTSSTVIFSTTNLSTTNFSATNFSATNFSATTSSTITSGRTNSSQKHSHLKYKTAPNLGEINNTKLPDVGIRSTYQSPLFNGIKKAIFGALFIHFAVFGILFITLSVFDDELSSLLGGDSSEPNHIEKKEVEVLMINMHNMQIEGKQTLLIEKNTNKNNNKPPVHSADIAAEPRIEKQSSELPLVKLDKVQDIATTQSVTTKNSNAQTEIKPISEANSEHTQPIKQTETIKQINKQATHPMTEINNTVINNMLINNTENKHVEAKQSTQNSSQRESTEIQKIANKHELTEQNEKKKQHKIKPEEQNQTRSQQPHQSSQHQSSKQKEIADSKSELSTNNLKDIAKPSNDQKSTVLHPTLDAQTESFSSVNGNTVNTNILAKPIKRIQPIYPNRARALNQEGVVEVMFDVNNNGKLENIRIVSANPKNVFEEEARRALRKWQYERKASKDMRITINFRLDGIGIQ